MTNNSSRYVQQVAGFFNPAPLIYTVLAEKGQVFPVKAAKQPTIRTLGQCYRNAAHLAGMKGLHYVEGFAISSPELPLPLEHAWCVDDEGNVYDPTWPNGAEYFGMAVRMDALASMLRLTGYHGFFTNLYRLRDQTVEHVKQRLLEAALPIRVEVPA